MLQCVLSLKEDIENFEWSLSLSSDAFQRMSAATETEALP